MGRRWGKTKYCFMIYSFVVGIIAGFSIGKFLIAEKEVLSENDIIFTASPTTIRNTSQESRLITSDSGLKTHPPENAPVTPPLPSNEVEEHNWYNVLLTLEDSYNKKDWKGFLQILEGMQGDEKFPLPCVTSLIRDGFTQSAITSIQNMDAKNSLFITE